MENRTKGRLSPFLLTSAILHGSLFAIAAFGPALFPTRAAVPWGSSSDKGVKVGIATSLPGIPLPSPPVVREEAKPTESKTLNPKEVAPKKVEKSPTKAEIQIPSRGAKPPAKQEPDRRTASAEPPALNSSPVAPNAIPGAGGQIALPYGQNVGTGPATFGGDGTFGSRFPEYVNSMTNAVRQKWTDAIGAVSRGASPKVCVNFTLDRAGKPSNLEGSESSGSVSLDNSAKRAILTATIPPLPRGYSGSSVDVRFCFEYSR
jgi:periplasmic protein TonB